MGDAMMDIELIYNLLDWKNSEKVQAEGIEMAAEIPGVQLFLQPNTEKYNICIHAAETDNDDIWLNNLISLKKKRISNLTASEINIQ